MALDATVKGPSANSYVTESEANSYLTSERLYITAWTSANTSQREQALIWATFLLDASFEYNGYKRTTEQALRWPRAGARDPDGNDYNYDTLPALLKKATSTLALHLLTTNSLAEPALIGLGIKEAKVGPLQVEINETSTKDVIPDEVRVLMTALGYLKGEAGGHSGSVTLLRG